MITVELSCILHALRIVDKCLTLHTVNKELHLLLGKITVSKLTSQPRFTMQLFGATMTVKGGLHARFLQLCGFTIIWVLFLVKKLTSSFGAEFGSS